MSLVLHELCVLFFKDTATTCIYTYLHTLSLHAVLPICSTRRRTEGNRDGPAPHRRLVSHALADRVAAGGFCRLCGGQRRARPGQPGRRSEEHTSELQSLMRSSYAVFCLKKKKISK